MFVVTTLLACLLSLATAQSAPTITWDRATLHLVAADGHYGRIITLKSGAWLAGFSRGPAVWSSVSNDAGATWSEAIRVGDFANGHATNSELIELADGRVMYLFNERDTRRGEGDKPREPDNGIAVAFSADEGKSWSPSTRIYGGGPMWEPAAYQRGNVIYVLFADEKPFPTTNEQQISRLLSRDGGKTWEGPAAISFRKGHRDGMPVPVWLANGVAVAIEDDGLSGTFKPAIIDLSGPEPRPIGGDSPRRWSALDEPLEPEVYAGAPYIVRLEDKATVLSAQVAPPGKPRQMLVWVGDAEAKHFAGRSSPFEVAGDAEQLWNALMEIDDQRVVAIAGTTIDGKTGLWTIEGRLTR